MNQKKIPKSLNLNSFVIFLLLFAIGLMIYIIAVPMGSEGAKCTADPLVYGANKFYESSGVPVRGTLDFLTAGRSTIVHFNHNESWLEQPGQGFVDIPVENFTLD